MAEKYAQQACEARRDLADAHFQLARIRLNRRNYSEAWRAALQAITLDHRYAARLPLDSEFRRNAAQIKPAWKQYAKDLKTRLEAAAQSAAAVMRELAKSREETNRMKHSRAFEVFDLVGQGLAEARARFQKMTELANTLSPEAEKSLRLLADGLRKNSPFAFLEAEPKAQEANDLATRALAASREAAMTIQKVEELSQNLPPKPKKFRFPALGIVGFPATIMLLAGIAQIVDPSPDGPGIVAAVVFTLISLALVIGISVFYLWFPSEADYTKQLEKFDWQAANAPQTTTATVGSILGRKQAKECVL